MKTAPPTVPGRPANRSKPARPESAHHSVSVFIVAPASARTAIFPAGKPAGGSIRAIEERFSRADDGAPNAAIGDENVRAAADEGNGHELARKKLEEKREFVNGRGTHKKVRRPANPERRVRAHRLVKQRAGEEGGA